MIRVNMNPLGATHSLPYLGRPTIYNNSDWEDLYSKLSKTRKIWGIVEKLLGKMGLQPRPGK